MNGILSSISQGFICDFVNQELDEKMRKFLLLIGAHVHCIVNANETSECYQNLIANTAHIFHLTDRLDENTSSQLLAPLVKKQLVLFSLDDFSSPLTRESAPDLNKLNTIVTWDGRSLPYRQLSGLFKKMGSERFFGYERYLSPVLLSESHQIIDSSQRSVLRRQLASFVERLEVFIDHPPEFFAVFAAEILDEFLMNAIWDANPKYREASRKIAVQLSDEERISVEWGFDGIFLAISVKDQFGTFTPSSLQALATRFATASRKQQVQMHRGQGGAGLGLHMVTQRASGLVTNLVPGVASEIIGFIDLTQSLGEHAQRRPFFQLFCRSA
jgi:hypothetical protein